MLADQLGIQYRHPAKTPIQLQIEDNRMTIDCCVRYNRRALQLTSENGESLADLIEAGIQQAWSGQYQLEWPELAEPVSVEVVFHRDERRRPAKIGLHRMFLMPAHVISPLWRRLWGIIKTGQFESMGTNWSLQHPGRMVLPLGLDAYQLKNIAAHEAGHLFGLGDAYAAIYRFYYGVPGKEAYMMYSNHQVQVEEISMLLRAHQTGRMQFFPRRWNGRNFIRGFQKDLKARAAQLERQIIAWRKDQRHQRDP